LIHQWKTSSMDLAVFTTHTSMEKGFQPSDERLQDVCKIARSHDTEPRSKTRIHSLRQENHKSGISNTKWPRLSPIKSVHLRNDLAWSKVQKGTEKYIQTGKPSNIITTSHHRVPMVVGPDSQV
jgi:hypothetical protein